MMNQNIGELGRAFLAQRTELGIEFDDAWDEWERINTLLTFMFVDCPEIRDYQSLAQEEQLRLCTLARQMYGEDLHADCVMEFGIAAKYLFMRLGKTATTNSNAGKLGRAFIAQRTELGIGFEEAWDEWQHISTLLKFIVIDCPEVRSYYRLDRDERSRIRKLAQQRIGSHIRSDDLERLGYAASCIGVSIPVRPYHMDRDVIWAYVADAADREESANGYTEKVASLRNADEVAIEETAHELEAFAVEHSLWAVPPQQLLVLFARHFHRNDRSESVEDGAKDD